MSTETTTAVSTETAAPDVGGAESFSAEERAYFDSRGEASIAPATQSAPLAEGGADTQAADQDGGPDDEIILDQDGTPRSKRNGRFVPHQAFHKEREGRKAAQESVRKLEIEHAQAVARLNVLAEALNTQAAPAEQKTAPTEDVRPDPEKDVFGYIQWQERQLQKLQSQLEETKQSTTSKLSEMETGAAYRNDAIRFSRTTPDFADAYQHLTSVMSAELEFRGITDPAKRMSELVRMEREEVQNALKAGKPPAEHIYQLAKIRGFTAKAAEGKSDQPTSEQNSANAAAAAELARIEKGRNAARSLSSAGGGAPAALTGEALASMSEAEFSALLSKQGGGNAALRKLMGM